LTRAATSLEKHAKVLAPSTSVEVKSIVHLGGLCRNFVCSVWYLLAMFARANVFTQDVEIHRRSSWFQLFAWFKPSLPFLYYIHETLLRTST